MAVRQNVSLVLFFSEWTEGAIKAALLLNSHKITNRLNKVNIIFYETTRHTECYIIVYINFSNAF